MGKTARAVLVVAVSAILCWPHEFGHASAGMGSCPASAAVEACPKGWLRWASACYRSTPVKDYGLRVRVLCQSMGGRLAVPSSEAENEVVRRLIPDGSTAAYLGCHQVLTVTPEAAWECEPPSSRENALWKWRPNAPSGEKCLVIHKAGGGWDDSSCTLSRYGICKRAIPTLHF